MGPSLSISGWSGTYKSTKSDRAGYIITNYDVELGPHIKALKFILKDDDYTENKQTEIVYASIEYQNLREFSTTFPYQIFIRSEHYCFSAYIKETFVKKFEGIYSSDDDSGTFIAELKNDNTNFLFEE